MLKKNRKGLLLASGLLGALTVSTAAGIVLSACSTTSSTTPRPDETESVYTDKINWNDANSLTSLVKDEQGLYYSDESKTNVIGFNPSSVATTITIPATVTTISGYLKVTVSGSNETTVETGAFEGNTSIITIQVASGSKLTTIDKQAFKGCTSLTGLSSTSGVTKIGTSAFEGCTALKPISLTKVQSIGATAFSGCTAFDGAVNLSSVSTIGNNTFKGTAITSVDASRNSWLTSIGNNAFDSCTSLTAVTLPSDNISNLTSIGSNAFSGCTSLTTVAPSGQTGFYATSKITSIGGTAFKNTVIESIDFSTTSIDNSKYSLDTTFNEMHKVTLIKLPNTLKNIGPRMFNKCGDEGAGFDLVLPSSIVNFRVYDWGGAAFANSGLKSIDMSKITSYDVTSNMANVLNDYQFNNATKLETVILKPGTTTISSGTFQNCTSLKVVREPNQTYTSGYVATSSITSILANAFKNAFVKNGGATIDLSAATLKTAPNAFANCNASSVKLPSTAAVVGVDSFFGSNVETLTLGANGISTSGALFTGKSITANTDKTTTPKTYATGNLPFGNNASLTNLNYNNFASSGTTANASSAQTLFETTSADTWDQVAAIVNSFSNYSYAADDASTNSGAILPANLSTWTADTGTSATRKSKVVTDTSITKNTGNNNKLSSIAFDNCFDVNKDTIGKITIGASLASNKFIHNGVTWNYTNNGTSITLTGEANMYKATVTSGNASNSFLTFFNNSQVQVQPSNTSSSVTYNIPSQAKVTVTLTIATKSAA